MLDGDGMILDLTGSTPLSPENARKLNELAIELRPLIVGFVESISLRNMDEIDWWVTPLASRNPFASRLFLSCCRIALLDSLLVEHKAPTEVWVDSHAMEDLVSRLGSRHGARLQIRIVYSLYLRDNVWRPVRNLLTAIFHTIMQFSCVKLLLPRSVISGTSSCIVVDTFLYTGSVREGVFHDRHFPDINQSLTAEERAQLMYFPTFYKVRNYPRLLRQLCKLRERFLFKEDYLCLRDYLYAFGQGFRVSRIRLGGSLMLNGLSVDALLLEDIRRGWMWPSAIEALLKYCAIRRMREIGVRIERVVDWFENQDIDRGANAGYRRYYPEIEVVGYIGFVASQHYLCMYPTSAELEAKVLPTKLAVMGKGFVEIVKEFCPDIVVDVAPALRYPVRPPSIVHGSESNKLTMLVALPVVRAEALEILDAVRHFVQGLEGTSLETVEKQILIKPHPASDVPRDDTFSTMAGSKARVTWVDEKLDSLLLNCDVLVSAASSACFEALTMGVPVVVFGSCYGLTYIPIPQPIPPEQWRVCYSWEEMLSAIMEFRTNDVSAARTESTTARLLQEEYLETVTRKGVRHLVLGVDDE